MTEIGIVDTTEERGPVSVTTDPFTVIVDSGSVKVPVVPTIVESAPGTLSVDADA